jgi:hypothetical protein
MKHIDCQSYYVYLHKKASTGEVFYVGKGKGGRAWSRASRSGHWKNTVQKNGLVVEFAHAGLKEWAALEIERELIALYGRADEGLGGLVNCTDGGEGCSGRPVKNESREKMAAAWEGRKTQRSESIKKGISEVSARLRHLEALKRNNQKRRVPVFCVEKNMEFSCAKDAASWLKSCGIEKANATSIRRSCNNTRLNAYGLTWCYGAKNG